MKVKQFIGPLPNNGPISFNVAGASIIKIGIERPHSLPLSEAEPKAVVNITGYDYVIGETDILEFDMLDIEQPQIIVKDISPYFILNIGYI